MKYTFLNEDYENASGDFEGCDNLIEFFVDDSGEIGDNCEPALLFSLEFDSDAWSGFYLGVEGAIRLKNILNSFIELNR